MTDDECDALTLQWFMLASQAGGPWSPIQQAVVWPTLHKAVRALGAQKQKAPMKGLIGDIEPARLCDQTRSDEVA